MTPPVRLGERAIISVTGEDAETFLDGLITVSARAMSAGARRHGALLTPQGKLIADMIVERTGDGFLLDCAASAAAPLVKRLTMFRLRAKVEIAARDDLCVVAFEGAADPRSAQAPHRSIVAGATAPSGDTAAYTHARIVAGVAEQGADFGEGDVFPADINMDVTGGVDFRKGCFVGQEVVSRMKRRGTARRRTLTVSLAEGALALPATIVSATGDEIGVLTSAVGDAGLARVRIDRMHEAMKAGARFSAGEQAVVFHQPDWLQSELGAMGAAKDG
jgi:folate-binding protein YgfZ